MWTNRVLTKSVNTTCCVFNSRARSNFCTGERMKKWIQREKMCLYNTEYKCVFQQEVELFVLLICLTSCSRLLYSPSVFSLMIMMSMFLWRVWTPGRDWQCITLANRSKLVLLVHIWTPGGRRRDNNGLTDTMDKHMEEMWNIWQKSFYWSESFSSYRRRLFLDLTDGIMLWLVSMLPIRKGKSQSICGVYTINSVLPTACVCDMFTYPWGQLHYGGWLWLHCWYHSQFHQKSWHAPPQNPLAHSWTYSMITNHVIRQSSPVCSQGFRTRLSLSLTNLKTSLTWLSSSGPIPSPGMRVTVCLPPYFAGGGCNIILTLLTAMNL